MTLVAAQTEANPAFSVTLYTLSGNAYEWVLPPDTGYNTYMTHTLMPKGRVLHRRNPLRNPSPLRVAPRWVGLGVLVATIKAGGACL